MRYVFWIAAVLFLLNVMCNSGGDRAAKYADQSAAGEHGFVSMFNGKNLDGWQGAEEDYGVKDGVLYCKDGRWGKLYTEKQYSDFILRFDFKLRPGGNNGIGVRCPITKEEPGFESFEIQVQDDSYPEYQKFKPVQYTGSVYGAVAAKRGHLKPVGEWNSMEIFADGPHVKVTVNGAVILDTDLREAGTPEIHGHKLTGLLREKGHIALCGHQEHVEFRNMRIKEMD
jgi:hypothetical protein